MALGLYFQPQGFTTALYDATLKQLDAAGAGFGKVPGRTFHCAMEADGVFDVCESMEDFQRFGETLMPIMTKLGVDAGTPMIMTVHNTRNG